MPRGRFISRSFFDNYRLNALTLEAHYLFGGINVRCSDREGRCKGQARWINNQVFPLRHYTDEQVDAWLDELWAAKDDETNLGLIERYKVNGRPYIWIPGFDKHQKGRHKDREAESEIPPPPDKVMAQARKHIIESKSDDKTKSQVKAEDTKVAGMIEYYEAELGRTLTPGDYDRLADFADRYPDGWFEKAVEEAKSHDAKAPMRYIEKILESWREKEEPGEVTTDNQGIQVI